MKNASLRFFFFVILLSFSYNPNHSIISAKEEKGEITGNIRFLGTPPRNQDYIVNLNSEICGNRVQVQDFDFNAENHGVKNVFVSLKSETELGSFAGQAGQTTLNSEKCRIEPAVLGLTVKQAINIKNSDPIFHSLQFLKYGQILFNVALPEGANIVRKRFDQPGLVQVKCSIHPFMQSLIYVADTPHFTLTDSNGSFQMKNLIPGKYLLKIWHKSFKPVEKEIDVIPGQDQNISMELEKSDEEK